MTYEDIKAEALRLFGDELHRVHGLQGLRMMREAKESLERKENDRQGDA